MADVKAKVKTPKKKASKREKKDWIAAYILIAPVTLGLLVFYIWPFIQNVWFSFTECKDQRKIHLPYPVFPSFGYHVCSCGHGLEMDLQ